MEGLASFEIHQWNPFAWLGIHNNVLKINVETIINTWIVFGVLILLIIIARLFLYKKTTVLHYLMATFIRSFMNLSIQTMGFFAYPHFALVTAIFIFIILCNWIALIPFVEEPTKDINTTLALGLVAFFYKDAVAIKMHGFGSYLKEFFQPIFIMFPVNVIGHFSKIISLSFRLFGNIFGSAIITNIYLSFIAGSIVLETAGLLAGLNFLIILFFIVFEGFIQAFVFAMITLTYISIAAQSGHEGELE